MNKFPYTFIVPLSYMYSIEQEDMGNEVPVTHRLVFINGVLDTPAALRDPRGVKHRNGWHSKHWRGQGEIYTGRWNL